MKISTRILASVLLLAALVPACNKQSVQNTYDKQETNIDNFVTDQLKKDTTATVTYKDGAVRVVLHDTLQRKACLPTPSVPAEPSPSTMPAMSSRTRP
jgi:hypothetical protein